MNKANAIWYAEKYSSINITGDPSSYFFRKMHSIIEYNVVSPNNSKILEVGGNIGEHITFVNRTWASYILTDIRSPSKQAVKKIEKLGATFMKADVQKLPFRSSTFDRVISTCLFHHLDNPTDGFKEIKRVLKNGGHATILLPNDPGWFYNFIRKHTTLRRARHQGLMSKTELIFATEHRNHYLSLRTIAKDVFANDETKFIGFPFKKDWYNMNALTVLSIRKK
jgi:phosphatidylethanolamine/phosphatidyl-N-methylethanolamine N-methyltransferase